MSIGAKGFLIEQHALSHFDDRPSGIDIDTIVLHSMHHPTSDDRFSLSECRNCLDEVTLSAHYLIGLDGTIWNLVPEEKRAWHAGESKMPTDHREGVNAFSIGVELVGSKDSPFTEEQYEALQFLTQSILERHPIRHFVGHSDIAPDRKDDPWDFDWDKFKNSLPTPLLSKITFSR